MDGNPKLTLGLIWTIILHFQVSSEAADTAIYWHSVIDTANQLVHINYWQTMSLQISPFSSFVAL